MCCLTARPRRSISFRMDSRCTEDWRPKPLCQMFILVLLDHAGEGAGLIGRPRGRADRDVLAVARLDDPVRTPGLRRPAVDPAEGVEAEDDPVCIDRRLH